MISHGNNLPGQYQELGNSLKLTIVLYDVVICIFFVDIQYYSLENMLHPEVPYFAESYQSILRGIRFSTISLSRFYRISLDKMHKKEHCER